VSRGLGYVQRFLWAIMCQSDKPMRFDEIAARAFPEGSFEADMTKVLGGSNVARVRSLRRALREACDDGVPLAVGKGGRRDPHRYCLDPMFAAIVLEKDDYRRASAVVEADPEAVKAANHSAGKLMQAFKEED
jgi:hypothetical protein